VRGLLKWPVRREFKIARTRHAPVRKFEEPKENERRGQACSLCRLLESADDFARAGTYLQ